MKPVDRSPLRATNTPVIYEQCRTLADEVESIRQFLWQITDEVPMTRRQYESIEAVKTRLWRTMEELRKISDGPA